MFVRRILDKEKNSTIKIIGFGQGGTHVVYELFSKNCPYHTISVLTRANDTIPVPDTKLIVGKKIANGLGCNLDLSIGSKCFDEDIDELYSLLLGHTDDIILVSGIAGGFAGSGLIKMIELINERNVELSPYGKINVHIVCSLPLACEEKASHFHNNKVEILNKLEILNNKGLIKTIKIINPNIIKSNGLIDTFKKLDKLLCSEVEQVIAKIEEIKEV